MSPKVGLSSFILLGPVLILSVGQAEEHQGGMDFSFTAEILVFLTTSSYASSFRPKNPKASTYCLLLFDSTRCLVTETCLTEFTMTGKRQASTKRDNIQGENTICYQALVLWPPSYAAFQSA
ncbi:hypothetical protein GQ43DRAFT_244266 [Delitschia confertaspora ATCC 74209]|uniref:Uncharacterized protein n=1 Tax=Delitschia confertaspora ATCC 74209 TaxID=1513339 RepID=A0A9P4JWG5_9PLEO|nr:hypothetical protein GQ43DRAFT_244266 [Delitschia confertaspora ATCC 74209]